VVPVKPPLPDAGKSAVMPPDGRCIEIFVAAVFALALLLLDTLVVVVTMGLITDCGTYCTFVIVCGIAVMVARGGCAGAAERAGGATTCGCVITCMEGDVGLSTTVVDDEPVR